MTPDDHLQQFLELCQRVFLRMQADGTWPWPDEADSTDPQDMVESEDHPDGL